MGLTRNSTGLNSLDIKKDIKKEQLEKIVALAGNPNVGKSTVFNGLTGMNQHTGNWPGKTVTKAVGYYNSKEYKYTMVDIPGTYSLMAHSVEEEVARNFICFGKPDIVVIVCDATCLERNLNLVLQTMEVCPNVIVCVNLMDEAKRKKIKIDLDKLSNLLGVPVVGTIARDKKSLDKLVNTMDYVIRNEQQESLFKIEYPKEIEEIISMIEPIVEKKVKNKLNSRWLSLKLLDKEESLINEINTYFNDDFFEDKELDIVLKKAKARLEKYNINQEKLKDIIVETIIKKAEKISKKTVKFDKKEYNSFDRKIDKILTDKITGYPVMIILLGIIFWITIYGANYPSQIIANFLFGIQNKLTEFFMYINAPEWLHGLLVLGCYRVLAWVVSVMLPPMAIFFPLFTLLEDVGYLPRIAYNLDKTFKRCCACGKQALTMCMGFGCNAAGIVGCRIIDSPRERLLAILTNNFVPCNGRFPTLIAIITMFFVGLSGGIGESILAAILLTCVVLLGIIVTFISTKLLSKTILKGVPSSFTLELPSYRKPQIGKVIIRSICDRTLFVLGRAIIVAIPAGAIIWIMANMEIEGISLLSYCSNFLDPFGKFMGLDGVILIAFVLGFPANEIVIPIIIMAYMSQGSLIELDNLYEMKQLFISNGWTWITAISMMLFSLMHWPCSTTLLTIKKETNSWKWTVIAVVVPTIFGIVSCSLVANIARIFI